MPNIIYSPSRGHDITSRWHTDALIGTPLEGNVLRYINGKWTINNKLSLLEDVNVKSSWFEQVNSGTTGTVTLPTGASILLNEWASGVDALASIMSGGIPTFESPHTSLFVTVTATLDAVGNYTLSGTPSAYPVAIIYVYKVAFESLNIAKTLGGIEIGDFKVEDSVTVKTEIDSVHPLFTYTGEASVGASENNPVWRIKRIDETTDIVLLCADGNTNFDNIWTNREALSYS